MSSYHKTFVKTSVLFQNEPEDSRENKSQNSFPKIPMWIWKLLSGTRLSKQTWSICNMSLRQHSIICSLLVSLRNMLGAYMQCPQNDLFFGNLILTLNIMVPLRNCHMHLGWETKIKWNHNLAISQKTCKRSHFSMKQSSLLMKK